MAVGDSGGHERGGPRPIPHLRLGAQQTAGEPVRPPTAVPDFARGPPVGRASLGTDLLLPAAVAALLVEGGDGGEAEVRHQALPDHRHGQLHAAEGTSAANAVTRCNPFDPMCFSSSRHQVGPCLQKFSN